MAKRVLFLSHDAARTGAPLAVLHLLEWVRTNTDWQVTVLLGAGGDLQRRFEALVPTFVWDLPADERLGQRLIRGIRTRAGLSHPSRERLLREFARHNFAGVYAGSADTARIIPALQSSAAAPVVCHVRELEYVLTRYVKTAVFRAAQPFIKHYVAASEATRQNLLERHGVAPGAVTRLYECLPARRFRSEASRSDAGKIRAALGIPAGAYVVASGGSLHWRKGPDLFLQVGRRLRERTGRHFALLWVGGPKAGEEYVRFRHDVEHLGLSADVHVTGSTDEPLAYLAAADVFVLTSREEPCGIMSLEAAVLERPVVCFDGAGGIPELLAGERGFTVPYADSDAMADVVARLWAEPTRAAVAGRRAADYVTAHHDIDVIAPQICELIEKHMIT
jgi:glycosyltransferase involved in cell wall biosynthesis